jgi:hypothetical protein
LNSVQPTHQIPPSTRQLNPISTCHGEQPKWWFEFTRLAVTCIIILRKQAAKVLESLDSFEGTPANRKFVRRIHGDIKYKREDRWDVLFQ